MSTTSENDAPGGSDSTVPGTEPGTDDSGTSTSMGPTPVLAVVGRPNVGKSTLVNRIIGRREAVVQDIPGVTRDRVSYDADWNGRLFTVVDTGGWDPDARGLGLSIAAQAEVAVTLADAVKAAGFRYVALDLASPEHGGDA